MKKIVLSIFLILCFASFSFGQADLKISELPDGSATIDSISVLIGNMGGLTGTTSRFTVAQLFGINLTIAGNMIYTGTNEFQKGIYVKNSTTSAGFVRYYEDEDDGLDYVNIYASPMSAPYNLYLPVSPPTGTNDFWVCALGGQCSFTSVLTGLTIGGFTASRVNCTDISGNVTVCSAQTGTGSVPVMQTSPQLITPNIGDATGRSLVLTGNVDAKIPTTVSSGAITVSTKAAYVFCTAACQVTFPVAAAGNQYCVRNQPGTTGVITLVNRASQYYELTDHSAWATVNYKLVSGGAATDSICIVGYDATHYATWASTGTWTSTAP